MDREMVKQIMVNTVVGLQGVKATELVIHLGKDYRPHFKFEMIEELIQEKKLTAVRYVLPNMNYREKLFLLPANTKIEVDTTN